MLRKGLSILVKQSPSGINRETLIKQFLKMSSKISYFAKATVSRLFTVFKNKTGKNILNHSVSTNNNNKKEKLDCRREYFQIESTYRDILPCLRKERNTFIDVCLMTQNREEVIATK